MAVDLTLVPLSDLRGISTARVKLFEKLDVHNADELLRFYPRSYENRGDVREVLAAADGECVSLHLEVTSSFTSNRLVSKGTGRPMTVQHFTASDDTGPVRITFFNRDFLKNTFTQGRRFRFFGVIKRFGTAVEMTSPDFELLPDDGTPLAPLVPVYPLTAGLTQKIVSGVVRQVLDRYASDLEETLPEDVLARNGFMSLSEALTTVHFPTDEASLAAARRRLSFEELYTFYRKMRTLGGRTRTGNAPRVPYPDMKAFVEKLPFTLTRAQKLAIQDVLKDISLVSSPAEEQSGRHPLYAPPARRLVQGDVGSGKTVVACAAIYACAVSGFQSALMAPTGILARQHYEEMTKRLAPFGIRCVLLVGGMKAKEKREALEALANGEAQVAVGTHALIEDNVVFRNLSLVITDEQHRFGVMQRKALENKTADALLKPHTVVMSATPIPRTLALILYCDLDISIIDEMPKGRIPVETYAVGTDKRERALTFAAKQIAAGHQVYIVCALAEESVTDEDGKNELKAAKEYCASLVNSPLGGASIDYIHGKMKQEAKDKLMQRFADGELDVLVSTTVIEVGVNVPNANLMLIENAERFGLAQLHQLRGRVGRGGAKSFCVLISPFVGSGENECTKRLDILCRTNSGFAIAEKDLALRGPGEFFGRRQSGEFRFALADMADMELVALAKKEAETAEKEE